MFSYLTPPNTKYIQWLLIILQLKNKSFPLNQCNITIKIKSHAYLNQTANKRPVFTLHVWKVTQL